MSWDLIRSSFLNSVFMPPNHITESIKCKKSSTIFNKNDTVSLMLGSQMNKDSSNSSYSYIHPTTCLSNFQLSTNSCVNIKGAELEVILSASHNDIFDKGTNKKDNFTGYLQPVVFPCEQDICQTNSQVGQTNTTTRLSNPITPQCFLNQASLSSTSLVTRAKSDNSNIDVRNSRNELSIIQFLF